MDVGLSSWPEELRASEVKDQRGGGDPSRSHSHACGVAQEAGKRWLRRYDSFARACADHIADAADAARRRGPSTPNKAGDAAAGWAVEQKSKKEDPSRLRSTKQYRGDRTQGHAAEVAGRVELGRMKETDDVKSQLGGVEDAAQRPQRPQRPRHMRHPIAARSPPDRDLMRILSKRGNRLLLPYDLEKSTRLLSCIITMV